jgi:hypothetical protein
LSRENAFNNPKIGRFSIKKEKAVFVQIAHDLSFNRGCNQKLSINQKMDILVEISFINRHLLLLLLLCPINLFSLR